MLVLGGTAWLGREVAREAIGAGYDVTCLARGESGSVPDGARLVAADRTQADGYAAVSGRDWDAVVDVARQPGQVRSALAALGERAGHWTFVSSCSVYADHGTPEADESAPLLPALDATEGTAEQYGEAKVACELACLEALPDRLLVARAGLIAGPGDRSDRFGYWPARFALAAEGDPAWPSTVLVPDTPHFATQTIDVRDLAAWLVRSATARSTGVFNVVGADEPLGTVLEAAARVAGYDGAVEAVDSQWLHEQDVEDWMGPRSLPLWIADPAWAGFGARDGSAARAAGLTYRPLDDLVAGALAWERELGLHRHRSAGLTAAQERALLTAWAAR
ncbi:oxidoreductase [Angustibacter sp. Root456]|nr:oxidoreductase [Angustibacter sp. Root456]